MKFDLATLVRRTRNPRRAAIALRPIVPTQALASNLYAAAYRPIILALTAALPGIVAAYERALPVRDAATNAPKNIPEIIPAGGFRDAASDVQPMLDSLGDALNRLVLTLFPNLRDWAVRVERWHRGKWRGSVLTATGVDLDTLLMVGDQPQSVAETIAWNTSLIRDVSDQTRSRIGNLVFAAFQRRAPAAELARELRESVGISRRRALLIASDQTQKLSAALDSERMREAGVEAWIWRWSHKRHGRPEHIARDGKRYTFDEPPPDMPGQLPYCGCRKQAVVEL